MGILYGLSALCICAILSVCEGQQGQIKYNSRFLKFYSHFSLSDAHLIVLSTGPSNAAVIAVAGQHRSNSLNMYPFTNGGRVSPACPAMNSTFSRRCRDLSVISFDQRHIILAPLQDAVGLMELRYSGTELSRVSDYVLSITSEALTDNCTPLEIIRFEGVLMVLCLENFQVLRSCNIYVDRSNISQSTLSCAHLGMLAQSITDYSYISNFVSYDDQHQVLFTVRGDVYGIRIDRQTVRPYSSLGDSSCNSLQYAGDHMFYAYCMSGDAKVYNTDQEDFHNTSIAIPYACPSGTPSTLFRVQQTVQGTVVHYDSMDYRTTGLNFTNGECYDMDTFFLLDIVEGTKLFRQSSGTFQLISNSSRDRNLAVFNGPYVVVYRAGPTEVVLYDPFQVAVYLWRCRWPWVWLQMSQYSHKQVQR